MNELANLCAAIEAMPHPERCPSWALSPPHAIDDSLCTCERRKALVALDALEKRLQEAYKLVQDGAHYNELGKVISGSMSLAEILNSQ